MTSAAATPIADLWRTARAWLDDALAALGGARAIQQAFDRIVRRAIKRRLRALETLVMKLLLIEAAALKDRGSSDPLRSATSVNAGLKTPFRARTILAADPMQPETWRVCFQLHIPPEPENNTGPRIRSLGASPFIRAVVVSAKTMAKLAQMAALRAQRGGEARERARAEKLARRFEALRRVFANPLPRARRLKQKLLALKQRAFAAAKRIATRKPPPRELDPILHERTEFAAWQVMPAFVAPDSS